MEISNDIIKYYLPSYLPDRDLINLSLCNKDLSSILSLSIIRRKKLKQIKKLFPPTIIDMITLDNLIDADYLEWDDKWMGGTGYLDRMEYEDFNKPFAYGKDCHNRPFICVKLVISDNDNNNQENTNNDNNNHEKSVLTIFQRYTDGGMYVFVGANYLSEYIGSAAEITQTGREKIKELITKKEITFLTWWNKKTINISLPH